MVSLKKRAISGTVWTLGGFGASQFIRLANNVLLTYLLAKEVIGTMGLVNVLMIGLTMFSDLGLGPSIIQDERGNDPRFLNTAWSIQVLRGLALWICACLVAYPFATFYENPLFLQVIPVASFAAVIGGFNSTAIFTTNRELDLSKLTLLEIISQIISVAVTLGWAYFYPSIWAVVFGLLAKEGMKLFLSHVWLKGIPNRFCWEPKMAKSLIRFGRWIFFSTAIAFVLQYVDRLVIGKFMSINDFAVYTVAATFAAMIDQIYRRMGNKVLFPLYSKLRREASPEELRQRVRKIRLGLMGALLPALCLLVIFGPNLIELIYPGCDPNLPADELAVCLDQVSYEGAGWMLQVLAIGWIIPVATLLGPICLAFGESFQHMKIDAIRSVILVLSMIVGGILHGVPGLIWGIAIADAIYYPFVIGVYRRYSLWFPDLDLMGIVGSATIVAIGLYFNGTWQPIWQSLTTGL